ncbi:MAG: PAS domain S-box protein [Calditrichia bacterium]
MSDNKFEELTMVSRLEELELELEEVKAERDGLRSRAAALSEIFQHSLDINIIIDNRSTEIQFVSSCVEHYLGYDANSLLGRPFSSLFPENETVENVDQIMHRTHSFDAVLTDQKFANSGGRVILMDLTASLIEWEGKQATLINLRETKERRRAERQKNRLIHKLEDALSKVKLLSGFLPICAHCKRIRDDQGFWSQVEEYIRDHSEADFSHGICPECTRDQFAKLNAENG